MTSRLHHLRDRLHAKLLTLLPAPTLTYPTINSRGQPESGVSADTIQAVMEWLFASLINAGYDGQSHMYWLHPQAASAQHRALQQYHRRDEPVLGYRCGDRMPAPPSGYYWRLMTEHPLM